MNDRKKGLKSKPTKSNTPAIGLIVEGATEFFALKLIPSLFQGKCVPIIPENASGFGDCMDAEAIAYRARKCFIAHLERGLCKIILCLDREDRPDCPGEFAAKILVEIRKRLVNEKIDISGVEIIVVVADRMFEAWILADAGGLHPKHLPNLPKGRPHSFEGRSDLNALLRNYLGEKYVKTTHGPKLFARIDFAEARKGKPHQQGSKSLDKLLRSLNL